MKTNNIPKIIEKLKKTFPEIKIEKNGDCEYSFYINGQSKFKEDGELGFLYSNPNLIVRSCEKIFWLSDRSFTEKDEKIYTNGIYHKLYKFIIENNCSYSWRNSWTNDLYIEEN